MRSAFTILVGIPARKRPFGRPTSRGESSIKVDLTKQAVGVSIRFHWLKRLFSGGACEQGISMSRNILSNAVD